jgi:hypothetical protein
MNRPKTWKKRVASPKERAFDRAAIAIGAYIKTLGGSAVVISGTTVGRELAAAKFKYFIQFSVIGRMPLPPKTSKPKGRKPKRPRA